MLPHHLSGWTQKVSFYIRGETRNPCSCCPWRWAEQNSFSSPASSILLNLGVLVSQGCCERLTQPGGLEQQTFIFPQPGGQKPKIKVLAGSASSAGSAGGFGPCLSLGVCGCWQRSETQSSSLCCLLYTAFPSVRLCVSSLP